MKFVNYGHQGDLNFRRIEALPNIEMEKIETDKSRGGITLAVGEHTNHAHVLIKDHEEVMVEALRAANGKQYIVISGGNVTLKHGTFISPAKIDEREADKHEAIVFTPGLYEQGTESEYDPFLRQIRNVQD
jgi:hypothetical protein